MVKSSLSRAFPNFAATAGWIEGHLWLPILQGSSSLVEFSPFFPKKKKKKKNMFDQVISHHFSHQGSTIFLPFPSIFPQFPACSTIFLPFSGKHFVAPSTRSPPTSGRAAGSGTSSACRSSSEAFGASSAQRGAAGAGGGAPGPRQGTNRGDDEGYVEGLV